MDFIIDRKNLEIFLLKDHFSDRLDYKTLTSPFASVKATAL